MCGFFFVLRRDAPIDTQRFEAGFASMAHRGPDYRQVRFGTIEQADGPALHWGAGHHRLSIMDLDPRSHQPFGDEDHTLVYNGEAYNFHALRRDPLFAGLNFRTSGDTEVVFEGLRRAGPGFMCRVNGMWSLALLDLRDGGVIASRDRYGKKPLFLYRDEDCFCLSSTIGAIYRYLGRGVALDEELLKGFIVHGALYPSDSMRTAHRDILQVPPASHLLFDPKSWTYRTESYFDAAEAPAGPESLPELLADAFAIRLTSDRPVGLLLSGGVDSSLLLSVARSRGLQDNVHCFIGETGQSDDARYARECVDRLGIKAEIVELGYEVETFERFLRICGHQEKPFPLLGNSMAMAEMYEKVSAQGIPVVLDGSGGDEVFGGYWDRYFPFAVRDALRSGRIGWLARSVAANAGNLDRFWNVIGRWLARRAPRVPAAVARHARFDAAALTPASPLADASLSFDEALILDAKRGRLGEWLWQNDRNAMMSSLENRSPLLDYRLAPYLRSGYAAKFVGAFNKHELRSAFDAFTPLPTQWRVQKQGFRWSRSRFIKANRQPILDLLDASPVLPDLVDVKAIVAAARNDEKALRSTLVSRLLPIAGTLEAMRQ